MRRYRASCELWSDVSHGPDALRFPRRKLRLTARPANRRGLLFFISARLPVATLSTQHARSLKNQ
jgi:hypothetical protein